MDDDLELPPAQRAGPMLDQPAVDARHVEHVPAIRQAPHLLADLEILKPPMSPTNVQNQKKEEHLHH